MALLALSINVAARRYPRLWAADRLPSDALQLVPVRSGGALVLCQHLVLFYTQVLPPRPALPCFALPSRSRAADCHQVAHLQA